MTKHYAIRKGVPLPKQTRPHKVLPLRLEDMEVGDSFTLPQEDRNRVAMAIYRMTTETHGTRYTIRLNPETGEIGCWRTK